MSGPQSGGIQFPHMRAEVIEALRSLSDPEYQRRAWGRLDHAAPNRQDDLTLNVHILYDDCGVLPDPMASVWALLYPEEVVLMERLGLVLGALIDDLGDSPDETYLADPGWPVVVDTARDALKTFGARP